MTRALLAALAASLLLAASPAQGFQTCIRSGPNVLATFGNETAGTLRVVGTEIHTEDGKCGDATTANAQKITVIGDASSETLTIDLAGGPFLGGGDEGDGSSEIEIDTTAETLVVEGTTGVDHITVGLSQATSPVRTFVNLNADETVDDVDVVRASNAFSTAVDGGQGADVLSSAGGLDGSGTAIGTTLRGEQGNDQIANGSTAVPGPGNDTISTTEDNSVVLYEDAPGPVTVEMQDGTNGNWGGAPNDGEGGSDTYVGLPYVVNGSLSAPNILRGSIGPQLLTGGAAVDELDGGADNDALFGEGGGDTLRGGAGPDSLRGMAGDDHLFGEGDDDVVDGGVGVDEERGGPGNDRLRQSGYVMPVAEAQAPNGADDLHGGDGTDAVEYAEPASSLGGSFDRARAAAVSVDLDDNPDDGAAGERDNVHSDVENLVGGEANDVLTGDGDANEIRGFAGADAISGGGGADLLFGSGARGVNPAATLAVENSFVDGADTFDGGAGADTVDANEGDDVIEVRDGLADSVACGPGNDTGRRDAVDTLAADCEGLALPPPPPPDPPVTPVDPPVTPPADPPVVPPPPPPPAPVVTPPPPTVAELVSLPSARRCASRRKFTVRVRSAIRGTVKRVTIFLNGRRVKSVSGSRVGLPIDLRGLPKGKVKVRLRVELTDGRVATDTRTYRTCATKKRRGRFGQRPS
jgi:Ca2+-binding RTX toxin-like protein